MDYLYILRSLTSGKNYVGSSEDPWRRLNEHNTTNQLTYTSKFLPWELAAVFEIAPGPKSVIQIERYIKRQKSKRLLEKLIDPSSIPNGELAQLVRVPHVRD